MCLYVGSLGRSPPDESQLNQPCYSPVHHLSTTPGLPAVEHSRSSKTDSFVTSPYLRGFVGLSYSG